MNGGARQVAEMEESLIISSYQLVPEVETPGGAVLFLELQSDQDRPGENVQRVAVHLNARKLVDLAQDLIKVRSEIVNGRYRPAERRYPD